MTKDEKMSKRFKDFGGSEKVNSEPLSFKIYDEVFNCRPSLPGKILLSLVAQSGDDGAALATTIEGFFEICLLEDSKDRFKSLLDDPDRVVTVETLGDITAWLVEEYSTRPTKGPGLS
jgi:hypothetical protein